MIVPMNRSNDSRVEESGALGEDVRVDPYDDSSMLLGVSPTASWGSAAEATGGIRPGGARLRVVRVIIRELTSLVGAKDSSRTDTVVAPRSR